MSGDDKACIHQVLLKDNYSSNFVRGTDLKLDSALKRMIE